MIHKNILFFSSSTCGPCRLAKSLLTENVIEELKLNITNFTAEDDWEMFSKHKVASVPTFVRVDSDGNEIARKVGFKTLEDVKGL